VQTDEPPSAPAQPHQEIGSTAGASSRSEKADQRAFSARVQVDTKSEKKPVTLDVSLQVRDVRAVKLDVENLLEHLGAHNLEKESLHSTEILIAELQAEKSQELLEKLKLLGDIKERSSPSEVPKGTIRIRIEMISPP
jgi:hypothetical protein